MTTSNSEFSFDALQMYMGLPYTIQNKKCDITIKQPTIGDIIALGENNFYSTLYIFIGNTTMRRVQLWDMGIDWNTFNDFDLFCMLLSGCDDDIVKLFFGDIDFKKFNLTLNTNVKASDDKSSNQVSRFLLQNEDSGIVIDESCYLEIRAYLRRLFNIYPKVEFIKGKLMKEELISFDRQEVINKQIAAEQNGEDLNGSVLLPMISACVNHPGFKYKISELNQLTMFQFMDCVQRLQIYETAIALNNGAYCGMADLSKIDKKLFDWMRSITYKNN